MRGTGRNGGSHRWACPEAASLTVPKTPGPWLIAPSPRAHPGLGRGRPRAASGQRSCRRTDVPPGARSALLAGASYIPRRDEEAEPTSPVVPEASERAASAPPDTLGLPGLPRCPEAWHTEADTERELAVRLGRKALLPAPGVEERSRRSRWPQ